jgi:hypothetical protein
MATAAQIEANRRNAQKSTGPRTTEGKNRSRHNALDHGCRGNLLVMPGEDPGEYEKLSDAWKRSIRPRNPTEEFLIDSLVSLDLQAKRIDRAQVARLTKRMHCGWFEENDREERQTIELGQKLFRDASVLRAVKPTDELTDSIEDFEPGRRWDGSLTADHPMLLVHKLQSTLSGCEWLLDQWAALRDLLERGIPWLASDQLKAVRLLGSHPVDAVDCQDVARVYLASHVILNQAGQPFQEILNELSPDEAPRYENNLKLRQYDAIAPKDAAAARQVLLEIVEKNTESLEDKAGVLRELAEVDMLTAGHRLSWDDTAEGEKLRRYELTCKRAWHRMFDLLMRVRHTGGEELDFAPVASVGRSTSAGNMGAIDMPARTVVNVNARPYHEPIPTSEANPDREKAPNEANSSVHKIGIERRDGQKAFRIDAPALESEVRGAGITGKDRIHSGLHRLELDRPSPLLDLSPIFGKQ